MRIDLLKPSNPTSHCLGRVSGLRIEAEFRVRGMFMHEVNQFLEQDEVSWNHPDTRSNHDAVKLLLFELVIASCTTAATDVNCDGNDATVHVEAGKTISESMRRRGTLQHFQPLQNLQNLQQGAFRSGGHLLVLNHNPVVAKEIKKKIKTKKPRIDCRFPALSITPSPALPFELISDTQNRR